MESLKQAIEEILTKDGGWMSFSAIYNRCEDGIASEKVREAVDALLRRKQLQMVHGPLGLEYALPGIALPADRREPSPAVMGDPNDVQTPFRVPAPKAVKWRDPGDPKRAQNVKTGKAPSVATPQQAIPPAPIAEKAVGRGPTGQTSSLIMAMLEHETNVTPEKIASDLKISKTTAIYHLRKLGYMPEAKSKSYFKKATEQSGAISQPEQLAQNSDAPKQREQSLQEQLEEALEISDAEKVPAVHSTRKGLPPASFALWSTGELRMEWDERNWVVLDKGETDGLIAYLKRMGALTTMAA